MKGSRSPPSPHPHCCFLALGAAALFRVALSEEAVGRMTRVAFLASFLCYAAAAAAMVSSGRHVVVIHAGDWFSLPGYRFAVDLLLDRLAVPFALFSTALTGVVGAFARRYVHRESGFNRFFTLLALFATGMNLIVLAGSIELAFAGWELVGLSSALLIAFFHERRAAVENGFRALVVYRVCDAGFLVAAVLLRHWAGSGEYADLFGHGRGRRAARGQRAAAIMAPRSWLGVAGERGGGPPFPGGPPGGGKDPPGPRDFLGPPPSPPVCICCSASRRCSPKRTPRPPC
ncbi:MAG: proton-conducting transporter membrane subunit [Deltaproteobacteria bacterium]|nr:proton-conducting transporter membrane subunit [Deltaproteobacteria bacterium]